MLDRLLEHIIAIEENELPEITLQNIAICGVWYDSLVNEPDRRDLYKEVPEIIKRWLALPGASQAITRGRRHQWVLRELIDELDAGRIHQFTWEEAHFLLRVHELTSLTTESNRFDRVNGFITRHLPTLLGRCRMLQVAPGIPAIAARLHVITTDDLQRAKPREVKSFAGIALPSRGPVFLHKSGHLEILGNVPENCTVVVEKGSCSVHGYVMGKIAVTQHCEVRENVSGVVVSRQGDIRARNIIVRAYVVAKWGSVYCVSAESPTLVFSGTAIHVEKSAVTGMYTAPRIHVDEEVNGGQFNVSTLLTAGRLRSSQARELNIVLRRELSCEDHGEQPGPEAERLLVRAARLRRNLAGERTALEYANSEAEHAAGSALVYLTGSENLHPVAERLQKVEQRLALVNRTCAALQTLELMAEDRLSASTRRGATSLSSVEDGSATDEALAPIDEIKAEVDGMKDETQPDHDIADAMSEISLFKEKLLSPGQDYRKSAATLGQIRERLHAWRAERAELTKLASKYSNEMSSRDASTPDGQSTAATKVAILRRLLLSLREKGLSTTNSEARLLQSRFMRMALRTVNNAGARKTIHDERIAVLRNELKSVAHELQEHYQISVPEGNDLKQQHPRVTGRFDLGVRIFADPFLIGDPAPPAGSVIITKDSGTSVHSYIRKEGHIVAVDPY